MARTGKIARMPHHIREEINTRLHAGQAAPEILGWLHKQEEALRVLDQHFSEQPVTAQNLSEWRQGGYQDWLRRRETTDRVRELSQYALHVAEQGGGDLMASTAAIAGGQLLEILESLDPQAQKTLIAEQPGTYIDLLDKLARLQKSGADARRAAQAERAAALAQKKLDLEVAKFQRQTCEKFLDFRDNQRATEIADSGDDRETKIAKLIETMWGDKPKDL